MGKGAKAFVAVLIGLLVVLVLFLVSVKNTYNRLVALDEQVKTQWAQVQTVLQRRMDLIPNLVETVKGYATFERQTLEAVIQARANATRPELNVSGLVDNPEALNQYMQAQNALSQALGRLLVVVERYPELRANENFIRLQDELAGTENRIAVERRRYNDAVREYNQTIRRFPTVLFAGLLGFQPRPYFEAPAEAQQAPRVDFGTRQ
ncbi:MAG: LemA family protein [candidate division KSB1 bacterium]|nr:LemA family protein [candidate division KSB1 bacterium]